MGTWVSEEVADSRTHSVGDRWNEWRLELHYVMRWTPTDANDPFPGEGHVLNQLPIRPQQRLPSTFWAGGGANDSMKPYICRSVQVSRARERPFTWNVVAVLTSREFNYNETWGQAFVKQTRTSGIRTVAAWRDATRPANGAAAWPASADMGGTKIDLNGNPRSRRVKQQTIQIETLLDRTPLASGTPPAAADPAWSTWLSTYVNKRNSAAFLGWPIGTVLCQGISATLDDETWRITITYVYDEWFHLEQLALPHPTGEPKLLPGATIAGVQYKQASSVVWYQPYPDTADLKNLFDQAIYDQFDKAGPAYP